MKKKIFLIFPKRNILIQIFYFTTFLKFSIFTPHPIQQLFSAKMELEPLFYFFAWIPFPRLRLRAQRKDIFQFLCSHRHQVECNLAYRSNCSLYDSQSCSGNRMDLDQCHSTVDSQTFHSQEFHFSYTWLKLNFMKILARCFRFIVQWWEYNCELF